MNSKIDIMGVLNITDNSFYDGGKFNNLKDSIKVPIVVRLQGTNSDKAKKIIDSSGLDVISAVGFKEAADKIYEAIN